MFLRTAKKVAADFAFFVDGMNGLTVEADHGKVRGVCELTGTDGTSFLFNQLDHHLSIR